MKICIRLIMLLFVSILTLIAKKTVAQSEDCRIRYSYDVAGNRIKREYKCITISGPYDPGPETGNPGSVLTVHRTRLPGCFTALFRKQCLQLPLSSMLQTVGRADIPADATGCYGHV
jgi:hypothetical protein